MSFKTNLKRARERKKLTQQQLANLLDVSVYTIGKWESGKSKPRTLDDALALARTLGTTVGELIGE